MKLRQLYYFQVVCKYSNITRASSELHVSQPSISSAIRELEEEFHVTLFSRLSKGLVLTEEGKVLLEETNALLSQAACLEKRMNSLSQASQTVRLGMPPMLAALLFPTLLTSFRQSFPGIALQLEEHGTLTNRQMILENTLDAAIISCEDETELPSSIGYYDICSLNCSLYLSIEHPLASRTSVTLQELSGLPLVLLSKDTFLTDFLSRRCRQAGVKPRVILHTNQIYTIQQLVGNRVAGSFLFDNLLDTSSNVVSLQLEDIPPARIRLIWNARAQQSSAMKSLIRFFRREYQPSLSLFEES